MATTVGFLCVWFLWSMQSPFRIQFELRQCVWASNETNNNNNECELKESSISMLYHGLLQCTHTHTMECVLIENGSIYHQEWKKETQKNGPIGQMREVFEWKRLFLLLLCYVMCCAVLECFCCFLLEFSSTWKKHLLTILKILRKQCKQWSTNGNLC